MRKYILFFYALVFSFSTVLTVQAQVRFGESWYRSSSTSGITTMALSPKGDVLAAGSSVGIEFYNAHTGILLKRLPIPGNNGALAWSPDGSYLIAAGGPTQFIDTATGSVFKTLPFFSPSAPAKFTKTGKFLIIGSEIIDTETWEHIESPLSWVDFFEVMPGDTTAITMHNKDNDTLKLVRFPSGEVIRTYPVFVQSKFKNGLAVNHKGSEFAVITNDATYILNSSTGNVLTEFRIGEGSQPGLPRRTSIEFSENDSLLLIANSVIWNIAADSATTKLNYPNISYFIYDVTVSKDWERFFIFSNYSEIVSVNRQYETLWVLRSNHTQKIQSIIFNSETITTTSKDSLRITWDHKTGDLLKISKTTSPVYRDSITPILSPSGTYSLKKSKDSSELLLFRNSDYIMISTIRSFKKSSFDVLGFVAWAWSPDEKYLITAAKAFKTSFTEHRFIYLWEIPSGKLVDSIRTPHFVNLLKISTDGKFVIAATEENGIMKVDLDLFTSVVKSQSDNPLKTTFYPNPLAEAGTVSYSVSAPGLLKISIHDLFGREVGVLKNEMTEPGNYTVPFKNSGLPNGTYFLKITSSEEVSTTHFSIVR